MDLYTVYNESRLAKLVISYVFFLYFPSSYYLKVCFYHVDIDECATGADVCDSKAACVNTNGSFICTCISGYSGDGITCTGECILLNLMTIQQWCYISKE